MRDSRNNRIIESTAKRLSQYDRAKIQIYLIEEFGLLIISRQRTGKSLVELFGQKCTTCKGYGYIKLPGLNAEHLVNELKVDIVRNGIANFHVYVSKDLLTLVLNDYKKQISDLEDKFNCKITFEINFDFNNYYYKIHRSDFIENNEVLQNLREELDVPTILEDEQVKLIENNNVNEVVAMPKKSNTNALDQNNSEKKTSHSVKKNDIAKSFIHQIWNEWIETSLVH